MKKHYFRFLLLCALLLAFGTVSFAQSNKQKVGKIRSKDFDIPKPIVKKNYKARKNRVKKWKKRCHYYYFKRNGKIHRRYRCDGRKI